MITNINDMSKYEVEIKGLSTDTKPTDVGVNSLFLELDTCEAYYFDGNTWQKIGESGDDESDDEGSSDDGGSN